MHDFSMERHNKELKNVEEAFGMQDEEERTLANKLLGRFMGLYSHGAPALEVIKILQEEYPSYNVIELLDSVAGADIRPWEDPSVPPVYH